MLALNCQNLWLELEAENMTYDMAQRLQYQGLSIEQYFQYTGQNMETLKASMKPEAEKKIKARLVLEAIAVAENIEATDEDVSRNCSYGRNV